MDSSYMKWFAITLSSEGINVGLFNFPYMQKNITGNPITPSDPLYRLIKFFTMVLEKREDQVLPCFIGGKGYGGRVASMIASEYHEGVIGCVVLGYPFYVKNLGMS